MNVPAFVDTNVLVYADDAASPQKRRRAQELIAEVTKNGQCRLSLQVLQEYFAAATRKLHMDAADVRRRIEIYARMDLVKLDAADLLAAIELHQRYQASIWDALIVRAAVISGCGVLYSEDLQPGFRIDGLQIVNPFAAS